VATGILRWHAAHALVVSAGDAWAIEGLNRLDLLVKWDVKRIGSGPGTRTQSLGLVEENELRDKDDLGSFLHTYGLLKAARRADYEEEATAGGK